MGIQRLAWFLVIVVSTGAAQSASPQQTPIRNTGALTTLARTSAALGRVPGDSVVTGTVNMVIGNRSEAGTFKVLTRGLDQVLEEMRTDARNSVTVFGPAGQKRREGQTLEDLTWEFALSSQPVRSPSAELQAVVAGSDYEVRDLGQDSVNGVPTSHLRFRTPFRSSRSSSSGHSTRKGICGSTVHQGCR
jgi:hypothetical protein